MKEYVLVVDDEQSLRQFLALFFRKEGFEVDTASSLAEAEAMIDANAYDLVLTDLRMSQPDDGLRVLHAAVRKNPWTQVVILTAYGTVETAKEAMKFGAYDYITKPFDNAELRKIVQSALARKEDDAGRRKALRDSVRGTSSYEGIIGRSEMMLGIFELIDRVAPTDANVMILGESGTGKELVAAALHSRSPRKDFPFVPINCAAIPETLIESELFGHVRGAFTGAVQTKKGLFETAHRGTLFLDEVGELPQPMQSKLLRAIQDRSFRRVGGNEDLSIDFRIVCASKRDLNREMAEAGSAMTCISGSTSSRSSCRPCATAGKISRRLRCTSRRSSPESTASRSPGSTARPCAPCSPTTSRETSGNSKTCWNGRRSWRQKMSSRSGPSLRT
ncbi:MAG: sigma-54-dependent transcriptional regulator [Verrucomicrobiota bacterium]